MNAYLIFAQVIGLCAMGLDIGASLQKSDRRLIYISCAGSLVYALHFFLLGAPAGAAMRLFIVAGFSLWLIYSIHVFSIGGIIAYSILLVTHTVTIFRLMKDGK